MIYDGDGDDGMSGMLCRLRVQNVPVDVKFPKQCNEGLWGGEGFIIGYIKKKKLSQR